ncbi:MAG: class I SAM-dependent methyltransferase [Ktedonobacterales bacterium]
MGLGNWFGRVLGRGGPQTSRGASVDGFYGQEALMDGDFVVAKGRKHVATAPYLLPKDLQEGNRLEFQHYMLRYALKGNYAAPLTNPRDILDIGTGTGRWAIEMATVFPKANVVGIDLVTPAKDANKTAEEARPQNYVFVQANALDGLPFADNSFDFVHGRLLVFGIPTARWLDLFREAYRLLRPGGWNPSRPIRSPKMVAPTPKWTALGDGWWSFRSGVALMCLPFVRMARCWLRLDLSTWAHAISYCLVGQLAGGSAVW